MIVIDFMVFTWSCRLKRWNYNRIMIFLKSHGKLSQFSQIIVPGQIKKVWSVPSAEQKNKEKESGKTWYDWDKTRTCQTTTTFSNR